MRHKKFAIVAAVAAVTLGLTVLDQTHINVDDAAPAASRALAPDTVFNLLDGDSISLYSLKGHTVWLHFWASWCVPCRDEFENLLKRMQDKDSNVVLLAVSADTSPENARRFLAPLQTLYRPLFASHRVILAIDPNRKLIEGTFQTFQYPETIIIAPDLTMQRKASGVFSD